MIEHQKIVLKGVSDNKHLFRKELIKSLNWIAEEEQEKFNQWVCDNFMNKQEEVIREIIFPKEKS